MDRLQHVLNTIKKNLGGMSPSQKLLIASLGVIMVMTLFLVSQYAATPNLVPVWPGLPAEEQVRAKSALDALQITTVSKNNMTLVREDQRAQALAALSMKGVQASNNAVVFENILKTQNWINSKEQNRQIYKRMLDNYLSEVVARFEGVESAQVFVDAPEQIGFGASARPAKASVAMFSRPGRAVDAAAAEAAARLVAGSVAGLEIERVSVTVDGKSRRVLKDDELTALSNRDSARAIERQFEDKLTNLLQHIEGVRVAVTATVDTNRMKAQVIKNLPMGEGSISTPKKELTSSTTDSQSASAAPPGVRTNVGAEIFSSAAGGTRSEQRQEDIEYATAFGTERKEIESAGGTPTRLVATIAVPTSFVAGLIREESPAPEGDAKPPVIDAKQIETRFDRESARIKQSLEPHFKTRSEQGADVQGEVIVMLVSGSTVAGGPGGSGGGSMAALGTMWAGSGGVVDKALPVGLAVVAVGMMLLLVRKAGRKVDMPSAEELVGLPPTLEAKSDLVGEADESETALAGIEVGEDEIKVAKMRESVGEFIKQNPDAAGKLLNRWIAVEH
jgi:flagellar M-ring protein FliF